LPVASMFSLEKPKNIIISWIDNPLEWFFRIIANRLANPTKENTNKYNTHILIDMRDEFLKHQEGNSRYEAWRGIWNIFIVKYETSNYYSDRFDHVLQLCFGKDWLYLEGKIPCGMWDREDSGDVRHPVPNRKMRVVEALNNKEYDKVLQLID